MKTKTNKSTPTKATKTSKTTSTKTVSSAIMAFAAKTGVGKTFKAEKLRTFVTKQFSKSGTQLANGTVDRMLRKLRQTERLDYTIVNREKSLYQLTGFEAS